jgi:hypothetical protein
MSDDRRNEYIGLAESDIRNQLATLSMHGYNREKNVFPLSMIDFMKSAVEYRMAKMEQRHPTLSKPKIDFFDELFRPRIIYNH